MPTEIIRPESRSAWLAARKMDVTASVAGALIGAHPYTDRLRLWGEKTGRIADAIDDSPILRRGRLFEAVAIQIMREDYPHWLIDHNAANVYYRDPALRMGATPDAFCRRPDMAGIGIIQIKTVQESDFRRLWLDEDGALEPPLWIAAQALIERRLTGADWAAVVPLIYGYGVRIEFAEIPDSPALFDALAARTAEFWRVVESGETPPDDWGERPESTFEAWAKSDGTIVALDDKHGMLSADADRYVALGEEIASKKAARAAIKARLIRALGDHEAAQVGEFRISAPTQYRPAHEVGESRTRSIRIRKKENPANGKF